MPRRHGGWSFDLPALLATPVPAGQQSFVFILLFGGLAVRLALFPFHAWLPIVAKHGTVAIGMVLLVGAKVGVYALLRFVLPLLPVAAEQWAGWIGAGFGGNAVWGAAGGVADRFAPVAGVCRDQPDRRVDWRGLFSLKAAGLRAAAAGAESGSGGGGVVRRGLLLSNRRLARRDFTVWAGLFDALPLLGLDLPGGGAGQHRHAGHAGVRGGASGAGGDLESYGWGVATVAASGNVLAAGYLLWAYQRIFLARNPKVASRALTDLRNRELIMAALLCAVMIGVGLYADPWIKMIGEAVENVARVFEATGH